MAVTTRRTTFVNDVYDNEFIRNEETTLSQLIELANNFDMLQWLAKRRLIANSMTCETCDLPCSLQRNSHSIDRWRWSCKKDSFHRSVRKNSFFAKSKLPLQRILILIYMWSHKTPQCVISKETGVSRECMINWCTLLKGLCAQFIERNPIKLESISEDEDSIKVEIDEDESIHRKYHRGQWLKEAQNIWRERIGSNKFGEMICCIADIYCV